jgi:hypothetical protein
MQIKNRYILLGLIDFSLRVKFYTRLRFTIAISSSCSVLLLSFARFVGKQQQQGWTFVY